MRERKATDVVELVQDFKLELPAFLSSLEPEYIIELPGKRKLWLYKTTVEGVRYKLGVRGSEFESPNDMNFKESRQVVYWKPVLVDRNDKPINVNDNDIGRHLNYSRRYSDDWGFEDHPTTHIELLLFIKSLVRHYSKKKVTKVSDEDYDD